MRNYLSMVFRGPNNKTSIVIKEEIKEDEDKFVNNIRLLEEWFEHSEHLPKDYGTFTLIQ